MYLHYLRVLYKSEKIVIPDEMYLTLYVTIGSVVLIFKISVRLLLEALRMLVLKHPKPSLHF